MDLPLVSVIIPTYNRKDRCIDAVISIQKQTFDHFEIIVVDDGSIDGTCAQILFGKNTQPTCSYLRLPCTAGVSHARNSGVTHAKGTWIAFCDSDDIWHPRKLEKQVAWIHEHPEYLIVQTKEFWIRNGVRVNPPHTHEKIAGHIFRQSLERCMITPSSAMIEKDFLLQNNGFNESIPACEDYDLWLRITAHHPVGLVDEYLLTRYGGHADQLSATTGVLDKYRIRALMDLLAHGHCDKQQQALVREMIVKKSRIVANGAKKRGRQQEYERYTKIAHHYTNLV